MHHRRWRGSPTWIAEVGGDEIMAQTRQSLDRIDRVLEAAGRLMDGVIKTTAFLVDNRNQAAMNSVYGGFFRASQPARTTVEVERLTKGSPFEIGVIAVR